MTHPDAVKWSMALLKRMTGLALCAVFFCGCQGQVHYVKFTTPLGVEARALYRSPAGPKRPAPAVIYNHGRLVDGNDVERSASLGYDVTDFVDELASEGYAALAPIRDPKNGVDENQDLLEGALLFLKEQKEVDAERIGIMGFSLGGAPSFRVAGSWEAVKCLVLLSPRIPPAVAEDNLESVHAPILILYGKKDLDGVIETADRVLVPGLIAQNKKFEVMSDFDVHHRWFMRIHKTYWQEVSKFLEKYLK